MRKIYYFIILLFSIVSAAQTASNEQFPLFPECENSVGRQQESCFHNTIQDYFYSNFKVPQELIDQNYKGVVITVFEVDTIGNFKVLYTEAAHESLKNESNRVFGSLPKIKPATFGGSPIYSKYSIKINIPLIPSKSELEEQEAKLAKTNSKLIDNKKELSEYDEIKIKPFENPQFKSSGIVQFSHQNYGVFEALLNQVGSNNHTASKPYSYDEVAKYYDFETANQSFTKQKSSWWGRKLWNENLVAIQGDNYWFTLNPIFDFRVGKDTESQASSTFVNTRGVIVNGGLGSQLTFTTSIYESQGRFADYYNAYAVSIRPSGGNPAIIPGIGIAKQFKEDAFDFPLAEANIKYKPNQFIDLQLGYGRNFLGDGYRSLLQSDGTSPYPFFKINTTFWKIKYTNTYMWLKDVRDEATIDGTYGTKYMASHYLSLNVTKKWNLGFFENVVWTDTNQRGFDFNFVNPLIFYRTVEFGSSSKTGNALLGLASKYKWNNSVNFYGQFLIDEFAIGDVKASNQSWRNKFAYQIGAKYYDAFKVKNLLLQVEYNQVRPYVYSHSNPITNYGHNNQSMGHIWGANFREFIAIACYYKGRYFADAKLIYGQRGFDFNNGTDNFNYGGNIYLDYDENRPYDTGVSIAQGNKTTVMIADLQVGYLVNPAYNLKVFGNVLIRNFDPTDETATTIKSNTTWFSIGLRSDLFNWYFDY